MSVDNSNNFEHLSSYDRLLDTIYQGALDTTPWQHFLTAICLQLKADGVSLILRPPSQDINGLILNYRHSPSGGNQVNNASKPKDWAITAYQQHFFALDPFTDIPCGKVITLTELMPDEELTASEFYKQYLEPAGVFHILGADTRTCDGYSARFRATRGKQESAFADIERQLLQRIMPHLCRAVEIHSKLQRTKSERDLYAGAVSQMSMGTILLNEQGEVLKSNHVAKQLLEQQDGIRVVQKQLVLDDKEDDEAFKKRLNKVINAATHHSIQMVEASRVQRPSGKSDLGIVVRPVPQSQSTDSHSGPSVAVFISDPQSEATTTRDTIQQLFGFTKAEAALTLQLVHGLTLAEASTALGVSQHTARAQLKSVFSKSGVSRQAELIRLVFKSVATLA
ncbi:DNA-binding CsgD family transcriptional regulator [Sinobacterium caligoides]|uniref:DNA-binding CsgD family transcriptional regulator n=1 Tax=Sinobacterium caligoides TaxID=933926 RepID=A0A3N2DYL7_9GAMM|nr:helix-turn-helix transcriptional regulator [Sinobacterium caligoides]ROS04943.1 DNA-binding CsgD family transcriptional regulator [Sinobacterium caligoides]